MAKTAKALINKIESWLGFSESNGKHKQIIDIYNSHQPLARSYKVKYTDSWCATTVSAAAISTGMTDIIPLECSCGKMIEKAKAMGIWNEDGNIVPRVGDIIMYDWDAKGGWPEHVGVVTSVSGNSIIVIEGNKNDKVEHRTVSKGNKYIRGYIQPKYETEVKKLSVTDLAREVIAGLHGSGKAREEKITKMGYDYNEVRKEVNRILGVKVTEQVSHQAPKKEEQAKPKYTMGTYEVTASDLNVRRGPGVSYTKVGHKGLSVDGKRHDKDKDGGLDKGTRITVMEVKGNWGRCPSGWVCLDYCKKIK